MKPLLNAIIVTTALLPVVTCFAAQSDLNKDQQLSYSIGVETAKGFQRNQVDIDTKAYTQGIEDVLNGTPLQMSDKAITQTLMDFTKQHAAKQSEQLKAQAETNQKASEAFLAKNKTKPGVKMLDDGIQYTILKEGTGPKPTLADTVTVDYEGSLPDGTVFDSSYKRNQPATFPLNAVIPGWQKALTQMPQGSTWEIVIPPELAYGKSGTPDGSIGPNQVLIFKVDLKESSKKS